MPEDKRLIVHAVAVVLVPLLWLGCAATGGSGPARSADSGGEQVSMLEPDSISEPDRDREEEEREARERKVTIEGEALDRALEQALDRGGRWDELHLLTECADDGFLTTAEVFGNGVTIWNHERQSTLEHGELVAILEALRDVDFPSMRDLYGEEDEGEAPVPSEPPASAMRVICRVAVTLDGATKQSAQRAKGPQSEVLKGLAWKLLDLVRPEEGEGMSADDLVDGLSKVADGRLAPESFSLVFHRKPELGRRAPNATPVGPAGFLMRFEGSRVTVEEFRAEGGYADPVAMELDAEALSEVATLLADNSVGDLPSNLWAEEYVDLVVEVLNRSARIQARQFARMTHATHGADQERFDRIATGLEEVAEKTLGVD